VISEIGGTILQPALLPQIAAAHSSRAPLVVEVGSTSSEVSASMHSTRDLTIQRSFANESTAVHGSFNLASAKYP
jgi:hypothetical protein